MGLVAVPADPGGYAGRGREDLAWLDAEAGHEPSRHPWRGRRRRRSRPGAAAAADLQILADMQAEAEKILPGSTPKQAMSHLDTHGEVVDGVEAVRERLQRLMDRSWRICRPRQRRSCLARRRSRP